MTQPLVARWMIAGTTIAFALLTSLSINAQETRYISDTLLVAVRAAPENEATIVHRGLSSGTAVLSYAMSEDSEWVEIETRNGLRGWLRAQYLQTEPPASLLIGDMRIELEKMRAERDRLAAQLNESSSEANLADDAIDQLTAELESVSSELVEIKRVSSAAIEFDLMNQQLVAELESERSGADLLRLENVRLRDRIANNQILDGALAVLLGVILAVVTPRLWPSRKQNDGWS
jgi:SH3 domain protein